MLHSELETISRLISKNADDRSPRQASRESRQDATTRALADLKGSAYTCCCPIQIDPDESPSEEKDVPITTPIDISAQLEASWREVYSSGTTGDIAEMMKSFLSKVDAGLRAQKSRQRHSGV
ncbi:MAG: hypothetical protein K2Z81_17955 [Cyanobacteria bacterium]|nr:hypothetical protein [Cyanobacteriota bacterium]